MDKAPVWEKREPLEEDVAFEIVRTAQFSLVLPHRVTPAERKLIELIIRRWTAVGYWLDLNLLGKGDRNKYPLSLPGVRAEERWGETMEALLKLCIACHSHPKLSRYHWPVHSWLAVVNDIVQDDINSVFETCLKKETIKGRRKFINGLKKDKMPSFEDWGPFEHSYTLFKAVVEINKSGKGGTHNFLNARDGFIRKYEATLTAHDRDSKAKSALIRNDVIMLQIKNHPVATGWQPQPLPKLHGNFWDSHQS